MARPYSTDLRDRVVASVAGGRTCRATAALFGVSVASVVKWSQRFRATGSAAAYWMGGHRPRVLAGERDWLLARLAELVERGVPASYGAVWRLLKAEGITVKKSLFAAEQDRPDVARRRTQWKKCQSRLDPRRLVFIDETWAKTNMTRPPRARAARPASGGQGTARALAHADLRGRVALRPHRRALRHRRTD